jgi:hypothetical protein
MATNNTCKKCGCEDQALTTPIVCPTPAACPDPQPCSEAFDSQCVYYTGDDIMCGTDIVVYQDDTVAEALNQVVDYFCNPAPAQCCPTFAVDISFDEQAGRALTTTLTNGTAPFTYEWTIEQNAFAGFSIAGATNGSSINLNLTGNVYDGFTAGEISTCLFKVKVTDSVGQIATAYYTAVSVYPL